MFWTVSPGRGAPRHGSDGGGGGLGFWAGECPSISPVTAMTHNPVPLPLSPLYPLSLHTYSADSLAIYSSQFLTHTASILVLLHLCWSVHNTGVWEQQITPDSSITVFVLE